MQQLARRSEQRAKMRRLGQTPRTCEAGGDPDLLAGSAKAWADRRRWPITIRLREATTYGMTLARFEEVAEFLDKIP
jgi:hypothetical protein